MSETTQQKFKASDQEMEFVRATRAQQPIELTEAEQALLQRRRQSELERQAAAAEKPKEPTLDDIKYGMDPETFNAVLRLMREAAG